ncbi:response regulator [Lacihabitans sp. LS3-19]|uniref:response regulator n=1 Tax=Lacihabitans sp. LS3-19 TaxID=2487335 RepID=UPI0020CC6F51|nr:response regulator [Lacihabitans sp. LS3-19]MCP9767158.1 response regulator [Lacihabitans sp. LS3-19]
MGGKTILLVEDDYLNRRLTKKVLTENGYQVFEAKNANIAIEILKNQVIDLTILDINLGESTMDGINLSHQIHHQFSIPFIYLTAYDSTQFQKKIGSSNAKALLTKPFKNSDLLEAIEGVLH